MDQGPAAISSASAMALSNQTIDSRKADVGQVKQNSQPDEEIIDVVETSDRDPRERLEYRKNEKPTVSDGIAEEVCCDRSSAEEISRMGSQLDIQA